MAEDEGITLSRDEALDIAAALISAAALAAEHDHYAEQIAWEDLHDALLRRIWPDLPEI